MTYKQLFKVMGTFTDEQMNMDVTFKANDEFSNYIQMVISDETNDVLDTNHPYFELQE